MGWWKQWVVEEMCGWLQRHVQPGMLEARGMERVVLRDGKVLGERGGFVQLPVYIRVVVGGGGVKQRVHERVHGAPEGRCDSAPPVPC